jgi:hypothetical protein
VALINTECRQIKGRSDQIEVPVLLDVSKTIKKSEKMIRTARIHSPVRLQFLDSCLDRPVYSGPVAASLCRS